MASAQLTLIDTDRPWKLDHRTVEIGRAGLAQARAALAAASKPEPTAEQILLGGDHTDDTHQLAA
ncbi:MAG: hypothetical protein AAGA93_24885 [Actinomycetota bacterium]